MPSGQKIALAANMAGVLAEEELRANPWGMSPLLSDDEFYDLILAATGLEEVARKKAQVRRAERIRTAQQPT